MRIPRRIAVEGNPSNQSWLVLLWASWDRLRKREPLSGYTSDPMRRWESLRHNELPTFNQFGRRDSMPKPGILVPPRFCQSAGGECDQSYAGLSVARGVFLYASEPQEIA